MTNAQRTRILRLADTRVIESDTHRFLIAQAADLNMTRRNAAVLERQLEDLEEQRS